MKNSIKLAGIALIATTLAAPAYADRAPTAEERAAITSVLRANGFVAWKEIELDDGRWEVDDARHESGKVYDLDIRDGAIVHRELEHD